MHHIHPRTTPTDTNDRSVGGFGDMCKSARCPWYHPAASGTTRRCRELPPPRRTLAAMSVPAEKESARNWEERKQQSNWAQGTPHTAVRRAPTGHTTIHKGTMRCEHCSNHQMLGMPREPSANTPPLPLQGAHVLHRAGTCGTHKPSLYLQRMCVQRRELPQARRAWIASPPSRGNWQLAHV